MKPILRARHAHLLLFGFTALLGPIQSVLATDIEGVQPAAVDQPRVTISFSRPATPTTPLIAEGVFGDPSIGVPAFYDTGASGIVIDVDRAEALGIVLQKVNGINAVFSDVGAEGLTNFNISEPLIARIAPSLGQLDQFDENRIADLSNPANFLTTYSNQFGPVRAQVGPSDVAPNPLIGGISVVGMPAMQGKVIVMDAAPTTNFFSLLDDDDTNDNFDAFMRTHTYSPGTPFARQNRLNPGIPVSDRHVSLSYASFDAFTQTTPGAEAPTLARNPFVGPNPLRVLDPNAPADATPPITVKHNGQSFDGSFLLDTGAAASFISQQRASELGVAYDPANGIGSANPRLMGVDLDRQFKLTISGIGGGSTNIAGFFAEEMLIRTDEGNPSNDSDPNHLRFIGAPVLVYDITVENPTTNQTLTLDGILGMNFFVASGEFEIPEGSIFPIFYGARETPFEWITFDEPNHKLGFVFSVPEPASVAFWSIGAGLLLRRRRSMRSA